MCNLIVGNLNTPKHNFQQIWVTYWWLSAWLQLTPLLTHWSYCSPALSHQYKMQPSCQWQVLINIFLCFMSPFRSRYLRQGYVITSCSLLWDVITYPCLRYLLLAPKSWYEGWLITQRTMNFLLNLVDHFEWHDLIHKISRESLIAWITWKDTCLTFQSALCLLMA